MDNKWKDKTIETQCCYLRVFFDFLCSEELIPKNPMLKIENIKCSSEPKNPFTATEMEMLRNVCYRDTRSMALLEFLDATGLRVGSVVALRWKNLDLFNRKGFVRMKGGDVNEFRFSEKSAFYLLKMLDERMTVEGRNKEEMMERPVFTCKRRNPKTKDYEGLTTDGIRYILDEIGKKCGISDIYPHKFRRTFACEAINRGMALEDLKALMHHKQYDTTLGYARLNDSRLENSYRTYCE